jgi:cobalt/nickel transport protein
VKLRTSTFLALGVLVALLLAGVVSWYASGSPDGLERVAEDQGFSSTAEDHGLADSPLADYATAGVADERLSGGLAGVVGVGATLLVGGGLFLLIRRRGTDAPSGTDVDAPDAGVPSAPPR